MASIREVRKRDDRVVPFDARKITDAIARALRSVSGAAASGGDASDGGDEVARVDPEELGAAVVSFLERRFDAGRVPGIEDIQDVVETVLGESGLGEIARAFALYRQKRAKIRDALLVRKDSRADAADVRATDPGGPIETVRVDEFRDGVASWSKSKITAALIREADMEPEQAQDIASVVERKVLASGIRRISTSLVRELVDNELFERGFRTKLRRQAPLGIPKYNLEQIIFGLDSKEGYSYPKTPAEARELIASHVLRQYALEETYSAAVADAHRDGRVHLHQLDDPIRFDEIAWELPYPLSMHGAAARSADRGSRIDRADQGGDDRSPLRGDALPDLVGDIAERLLPRGRNGNGRAGAGNPPVARSTRAVDHTHRIDSFLDTGDLLRRLAHLGQFTHGEIRLREVDRLLLDARHGAAAGRGDSGSEAARSARARAILERLAEVGHGAAGCRIALELVPGDSARLWCEALLEGRARRNLRISFRWRPRDLFDSRVRPSIELAAELLTRGVHVDFVPVLEGGRTGSRRGPGGSRRAARSGFTVSTAKVTLNLGQAAFRSVKRPSGRIEDELEDVVGVALKASLERRQFLARLGANRENPLWDVLGAAQADDGSPLFSLEDVRSRIGIFGLNECVKFLCGHELHEGPRAQQRALEILAFVNRTIEQEQRGLGLRVTVEETGLDRETRRLERLDRRHYQQFEEIDRGRSHDHDRPGEEISGYTGGVRIHMAAPVDPLRRLQHLMSFCSDVVPRGVLDESPELRSAEPALVVCLLEEAAASVTRELAPS